MGIWNKKVLLARQISKCMVERKVVLKKDEVKIIYWKDAIRSLILAKSKNDGSIVGFCVKDQDTWRFYSCGNIMLTDIIFTTLEDLILHYEIGVDFYAID